MRFGFVGLGWVTQAFHLPALRRVPNAVLAGGCDSSEERRVSWERSTDTRAYGDVDELLGSARPDVLVIATPPGSHAELCVRALDAGCHVYCEKPFVSNLLEADRVLEAADAAGRRIAVNHEFREMPIFKAIAEQVASGSHGRLAFCQIWQLMDLAPWDEPVPWRAAMNDRTLFEGGVHLVDLMLRFYGERPERVYAKRSSGVRQDQSADAIHLVTMEFPGSRLGQITIDRLCPAASRYVEVRADCERSSLRASIGGRSVLQIGKKRAERAGVRLDFGVGGMAWSERGLRRRTLARNPRDAGVAATAALLGRFVAAVEEGSDPPSSGAEARDVLEVVEAAYRSAASGMEVELASTPERSTSAPERSPAAGA